MVPKPNRRGNRQPARRPVPTSGGASVRRPNHRPLNVHSPTSSPAPPPLPKRQEEDSLNRALPIVVGVAALTLILLLLLFSISKKPTAETAGLDEQQTDSVVTETDASLSDTTDEASGANIKEEDPSGAAATDEGDQFSTDEPERADTGENMDDDLPVEKPVSEPEVESGDGNSAAESTSKDIGDSDPPPEPADLNSLSADEMAQFAPSAESGGKGIAPIGGTAKFFGIESKGNHIAYVLDKSSSMIGPNLDLAKKKLLESLEELNRNQKFSIYFFDEEALFDPRFINCRVSDKNRKLVSRWLDDVDGYNGTDPLPALNLALAGDCDVIFLLSDGEFGFGTDTQIARANRKKRSISTISMGYDSTTMKNIAKQNNGKYRLAQ